jgi:predicted DNA-binding protein (UPF0251 family)
MIKETVTMSHKELDRLQIIQESLNRHITQEQAAARIGISIRQVKRLVQRYRNEGPSGLVSADVESVPIIPFLLNSEQQ